MDDSYESLVTNVLTRLGKEKITVDDLFSMLLSHEVRLEMSKGKTHDMSANLAKKSQNYSKPNSGNNMPDNGNYGSHFGGNKNIICQICYILGYGAHKCRNMFNHAFVPK